MIGKNILDKESEEACASAVAKFLKLQDQAEGGEAEKVSRDIDDLAIAIINTVPESDFDKWIQIGLGRLERIYHVAVIETSEGRIVLISNRLPDSAPSRAYGSPGIRQWKDFGKVKYLGH